MYLYAVYPSRPSRLQTRLRCADWIGIPHHCPRLTPMNDSRYLNRGGWNYMYYPLVRTNLNTELFFFATRLAVVI